MYTVVRWLQRNSEFLILIQRNERNVNLYINLSVDVRIKKECVRVLCALKRHFTHSQSEWAPWIDANDANYCRYSSSFIYHFIQTQNRIHSICILCVYDTFIRTCIILSCLSFDDHKISIDILNRDKHWVSMLSLFDVFLEYLERAVC